MKTETVNHVKQKGIVNLSDFETEVKDWPDVFGVVRRLTTMRIKSKNQTLFLVDDNFATIGRPGVNKHRNRMDLIKELKAEKYADLPIYLDPIKRKFYTVIDTELTCLN